MLPRDERLLMAKCDFLLVAFGCAHPSDTNLFFQHDLSFDDQALLHNRNDRGISFLAHLWNSIDPPTNRNRFDLDPLTR